MVIKRMMVVCVIAVTISMISVVPIVCAEEDSNNPVSVSQVSSAVYVSMSKEDLFKIYQRGNIKKYEKKDNEEVFVFDDRYTLSPNDTITFYLVDGKVKSWDKNQVIFPTDEGLRSTIRTDISKEELLKIFPIGNLKLYTKSGNKEVGTFSNILTSDPDDIITFCLVDGKVKSWDACKVAFLSKEELHKIFPAAKLKSYARSGNVEAETFSNILTPDPDDTITFYLVDGKVNSWDRNVEVSIAQLRAKAEAIAEARLKAESDAEARLKAKYDNEARIRTEAIAEAKQRAEADAEARLKAKFDFDAMILKAESNADARIKAMEERSRYENSARNYSTAADDIANTKQQSRASSVRQNNWGYSGGLRYR